MTAEDVLKGLTADRKYIPSKYFYDARGSKLFETICDLPEYYPTRIELQLLSAHADEITAGLGQADLIELGAGGNRKIRILLDALDPSRRAELRYVPVDVCSPAILQTTAELTSAYPELRVEGILADFTRDLRKLQSDRAKLVLFLGSTIGNLDEREAVTFLREVAVMLNPGGRFLLGLDMVKPVEILEAAYNDSQGITTEFNKNVLLVINRELQADFNPDAFEHLAFFNREKERMEMHLRAHRDVRVDLKAANASFIVRQGETIRTEICRKFRRDAATQMLRDAGMTVTRWYSDPKGWFSVVEAVSART